MPIPHDYVNVDTSPKPCKCARIMHRVSEVFLGVSIAAFIYTLSVFAFSL